MTDAQCPICGKIYHIPDRRGKVMVETRFLRHKDECQLPHKDEFIRLGNRVGIVIDVHEHGRKYPTFTIHFSSGRMREYPAAELVCIDQDEGRERFYE